LAAGMKWAPVCGPGTRTRGARHGHHRRGSVQRWLCTVGLAAHRRRCSGATRARCSTWWWGWACRW
jgi:hypothetical protein